MTRDWTQATDEEILQADLLIELGLDSLPAEQQAEIAQRFTEECQRGMIAEVLTELNPEQQAELQQLVTEREPQPIQTFLEKSVPNLDERAQQELVRFKRIMLAQN